MTARTLRLALLGVALSWLAAVFAHAGWVEDKADRTVIHVTVHSMPTSLATDASSRAAAEKIRMFNQRFPEIFARKYRDKYKANPEKYGRHNWDRVEIELKRFAGINVTGVETDLLAIAGDMAPDVIYVNFRKSDNYIQNRFLYPLDKPEDGYMSAMSTEELDLRIHPKIWPVIRRKGPDGDMHSWAVPFDGALGKVLLYRRDLFDAKGIAYPTIDWTWDDLLDACRKMTDPAEGTYGLMLGGGVTESWYWITFLWSAGGEVMVYDEAKDQWRCTFDSRAAAVALDFYVQLCTEPWVDDHGKKRHGYVFKDPARSNAKWDNGQIAMKFAYIEQQVLQRINPDVLGLVPVPLGAPDETGRRVRGGELNSRMQGLYSRIENIVVRDAAWEYLLWYDCDEALRIKTRMMVEGGMGRFVHPKYLERYGYPEVVRLAPRGWKQAFEIAIETGQPEPYGRNSNFAYQLMTVPVQKAQQMARDGELPDDAEARIDMLHELLKKHVVNANEEMIGIVAPQERRLRRIAAFTLLVTILIAFAWVFRRVMRTFTPEDVRQRGGGWGFRRYWLAYVLLLPALLTVFLWQYVPLVRGSIMAFQDYKLVGPSTWVWLDNFGDAIWDHRWWGSLWTSARYCFLVIILTFLPPVVLAILLQEAPWGRLLFRTIYYLPAVITGLVTMLLWKQFYEPNENGVLNALLMRVPALANVIVGAGLLVLALMFARRLMFHHSVFPAVLFTLAGALLMLTFLMLARPVLLASLPESFEQWSIFDQAAELVSRLFRVPEEPYRWLTDEKTALVACVIPIVWAGMGPGCLIYLAALKGISDEFYEAADIDGATFVDKVLFVVFPILKPLLIINFVGVFIGASLSSANILPMTGGQYGTETADLHIFYKAYMYLGLGPATARAWMLGLILIGFTVYQLRILSRLEFRTTGSEE